MHIIRIDHLVLDTRDLDKSLSFYGRLPGAVTSLEPGRGIVRFGKQKLNIHTLPPTLYPLAANPVPGGQDFYLRLGGTDNIIAGAPLKNLDGARRKKDAQAIVDPDGNRIWPAPAGEGDSIPAIAGLVLPVADMQVAINFYALVTGQQVREIQGSWQFSLESGFIRLEPWLGARPKGAGDFCLITSMSIHEAWQYLGERTNVLSNPGITGRTGALGPITSFYLRDPDCNLVEIAAYPTP